MILTVACLRHRLDARPEGLAAALLGFGIIMLFGTALALMFSAANVFFRDFGQVVQILTNFVRSACR